ncbi:Tubulointerstitial nephritis antigen-like [Branchiostoma belcheri]|nr:Tubulointerstitial nephritis antigen-like [Branchiostoma belcheri]
MSRRRGRRRHRRSRARAASSPSFPACNVPDEPQDRHRLVFNAAMITMLLLVAVTAVVTEIVTVQWYYNNTAADTTSASLPPYRSWGYSTGTDPEVASAHNTMKIPVKPVLGDNHTQITSPTNDPGIPTVDEVRPPIQGPTVFGCSVQEEIDGVPDILKSWAFMTTDQRNVYLAMARIRIRKQIYEILNREFDPEMPPAPYKMTQSAPASKMTQSAVKPDTSTEEKTKGEMKKTETTAEDKLQLENATETTKNTTSHEGMHHVFRHIQRVETVALAVVGMVAAGSVAYSCTPQIT